jgi:hypothetical protein
MSGADKATGTPPGPESVTSSGPPTQPTAAAEQQAAGQPTGATQGQGLPFAPSLPIQGQGIPQLAGMMIQHGITLGQPQQNPAVMQHITEYLTADSSNRLSAHEARSKRNHIFRMTALCIGGGLSVMILAMPLVALARGDMGFVTTFLEKYFQQIVIIALALLGGGKLFEIFK